MIKTVLNVVCILLITLSSGAQTQFWSDTFEDTGAPSAGTRTPSIDFGNGGPPFTRYFRRTDGTDISLNSSLPYTNIQGTKYWAGEDLDGNVVGQSALQTITWTNINIAGKTGLSFRGLIAAWNGSPVSDGNSIWEGNGHPSGADFIEVEYSIDGGAFNKIVGIYCHTTGNTSGILKLDTNGDLVGDGTVLNRNFQEFTATIAGTGNTLSLRLRASNGSIVEEFAFDNFRLFQTGVLPVKLLSFEGKKQHDATNLLTWKTTAETGADHFEVERSTNGLDFEKTGTVPAQGANTIYYYTDRQLPAGYQKLYYRLRMVDQDGTAARSAIIIIRAAPGQAVVDIYPTITNGIVNATGNGAMVQKITVYTSAGQLVLANENRNEIDLTTLKPGLYFVQAETREGKKLVRVLKNQ